MYLIFYVEEKTYEDIFKRIKEYVIGLKFAYDTIFAIESIEFFAETTKVVVDVQPYARPPKSMLAKERGYFDFVEKVTNQNYKKGRSFEYRCMEKLRKKGWDCIRSFGSWGSADIRAFKDGVMLYIQCKWSVSGETTPDHYELSGLIEMAALYGGTPIFAGIMNRKIYFNNLLTGEDYDIN